MERSKEQAASVTRRLEKSRSQNAKLVEQVKESVMISNAHIKAEDNEMRDAELSELRKVGGCFFRITRSLSITYTQLTDHIDLFDHIDRKR